MDYSNIRGTGKAMNYGMLKAGLIFVCFWAFVISAYAEQYLVPIENNMASVSRFSSDETFCVTDQCYAVVDKSRIDWYISPMDKSKIEPVLYYDLYAYAENWGADAEGWDSAKPLLNGDNESIVAIIDTGMVLHNEFTNDVLYDKAAYYGYIHDDDFMGITPIYDNDGHGTHVAGIIGGTNRIKGTGFSKVKLLPFGVANAEGKLPLNYILQAINKIIALKRNGEPIVAVNMSYGQSEFSQAEYDAIRKLRDEGIIVVTAAGNGGINLSKDPVYPANYNLDNIITVGALDESRELASYSNYGGTTGIAAPGTFIYSTSNDPSLSRYTTMSGTSMATPFVTGAIGAAFSLHDNLTPQQAMNLLYKSAKNNSRLYNKVTNSREIDLHAFMVAVQTCLDNANTCNYSNYPPRPKMPDQSSQLAARESSGGGCAPNSMFNFSFSMTEPILAMLAFMLYRRYRCYESSH